MSPLRPIGDDLGRELARFGPQAGLGEVVAAWPASVGEGISRNAWPARIGRDGTLFVAAASSAWAFELTQMEESIRERLGAALGAAAPPRVRFAVGPLPEHGPQAEEEVSRTVPTPSKDLRAEGDRIAAGIEDPDLRKAVARAAAASLAASGNRSVW